MRQVIAVLGLLAMAGPAVTEEEVYRAAGGRIEELRAALDLTPDQVKEVGTIIEKARMGQDDLSKIAREKGMDALRDARLKWNAELRGTISGHLKDASQKYRYADWLDRKRCLEEEYDKAVLGLPPMTDIKLHTGLPSTVTDPLQKVADEGVQAIRKKLTALKAAKADSEEIARTVNDMRRSAIELLIKSCPKEHQKKLKDHIKLWLQSAESKLSKPEHERLARIMKSLAPQDPAVEKKSRVLLASILMHQEEQLWLRRGRARDILVAVLRSKREADIWTALNEYGAMTEVQQRRLRFLAGEARALFGTKELGKLVAEGILD